MSFIRLFGGLLIISLVGNLVVFLVGAFKILSKPYGLMHGEGYTWYLSRLVTSELSLYPEVTSTQLVTNPHTPLYMLITGSLLPISDSLLTGRIVTLVCGLLVCYLVFLIVRHWTKNSWIGLISSLLVTSLLVFKFLAVIYRMETMGVMFSLAGIYIFTKVEDRGPFKYLSILFFLLAFFTKQVYLVAPIAVCVYLVLGYGNWKLAFRFGGVFLVSLFSLLAIAGLVTDGQLLLHNFLYMWYALVEEGTVSWGSTYVQVIESSLLLWIGIGLYFGYRIFKKLPVNLIELYFLILVPVWILFAAKPGSAFHYGLETVVVGCILVGFLLWKVLSFRTSRQTLLVGLVVIVILVQSIGFPWGSGYRFRGYLGPTDGIVNEVVDYVETVDGPILSYLYTNVMLAETSVNWDTYDPAILINADLAYKDRFGWDQSVLVDRLESGYYKLVMLEIPPPMFSSLLERRMTKEMATAFKKNYVQVKATPKIGSRYYKYGIYLYSYKGNIDEN